MHLKAKEFLWQYTSMLDIILIIKTLLFFRRGFQLQVSMELEQNEGETVRLKERVGDLQQR